MLLPPLPGEGVGGRGPIGLMDSPHPAFGHLLPREKAFIRYFAKHTTALAEPYSLLQRQDQPEQIRHRPGIQHAVEQIQQAAEAGEQRGGIFLADIALDE